jgi:hypothetical protein
MYYTHTQKGVVDRIDVAISEDGLKWQPKGIALAAGVDGTWDALSVGRPSVLVEGGVFKMWYDGRKDFPPDAPVKDVPKSSTSRRSVGYATSKDGFHWQRHRTNPVFGNDTGGVDVKRWGSQLLMMSESREGTRWAMSKDGIEWTDKGLLVQKSATKLDAFGHVTPCLLLDPDSKRHRLYFGAAGATTWDNNCIAELSIADERLTCVPKRGN